jgi:hypothetical protein
MAREALLVQTLVELADTLVDDFDVVDLLTLLVDRCVEVVDMAAAGLMLVTPAGALRVVASSSEEMGSPRWPLRQNLPPSRPAQHPPAGTTVALPSKGVHPSWTPSPPSLFIALGGLALFG